MNATCNWPATRLRPATAFWPIATAPSADALAPCPIAVADAAVTDALVHDSGEFAPFLRLARHCEGFDGAGLRQASPALHLPFDQLNRALLTGLSFADSLQA